MTNKIASILDYSYPSLDPAVWDQDMHLFAYQRDFVLRILDKMYDTYGLKDHEKWVEDAVILGSLTTSKWLLSSDLDVHIRVNLDAFIATNMPGVSKEEAFAKLDEIRKEFDRAKILLPMSNHPIEFYYESLDLQPSNTEMVGVYSLMQDKWLKAPVLFEAGLDMEESKKAAIEAAEALAEELDGSLGKVKRSIQRIDELETVIKAWDKDKQQLFYIKVEQKLKSIEEEIIKDLKIKQDLVDARHENMNATSDNELTFKWLQRYGFFGILSQLKKLLEQTGGEVTTTELPLIEKIISQGAMQSDFDSWFNGSKVVDSNGKPLLCHHETNVNFKKVNPKKTTQGIFWFTTDRGSIDRGETGAAGHGMVKDFYVSMKNPAGWKEYEQLLLVQLKSQGYDGALLPKGDGTYDGFVFDNSQIWWVTPKKASLHVVARAENIVWVAPNSKVFPVEGSHMGWIQSHSDILKQYGIESGVNDASGVERNEDLWDQMLRNGWVRLSDDFNEFIVDCYDMMDIPGIIEDIVLKEQPTMVRVEDLGHDVVLSEEDLSQGLRKAIVKALQQKRLQPVSSLKQAFLKEAFEKEAESVLFIDFDGTIAKDKEFPDIGEPEKGVKEALEKLKELGYTITIYSCRANEEEGADQIKEYMEKHDLPYDEIYSGEKPHFHSIIDNKAIRFDNNWDEVVKQVEGSEKVASLHITALVNLPVVDPKTLNRKEPYALFIGTQWDAKRTIGVDLFNIYPMANADNGVPTVGLQTLVEKNIPVIGKELRAADKQPAQDISSVIKLASLDKKADVVEISTTYSRGEFPVLIDPTEDEELKLIQKSQYDELRYLDGYNGVTYVWDAYRSTHAEVAQELHYRGFDVDTNSPRGTISQNNGVALEMEASLKKEASYDHAYWIDPHGKIFQVRGEGVTTEDMNKNLITHSDWVRANIDMLVKDYGFTPKPAKSTGLFDMPLNSNNLIAEGWIRIGDSSGGSEWGVTLKDLNYIPQSVDNLLAQFVPEGAKITIEEDTSWQNSVQIEWPVNSVQLAVNQARRQQPVVASLDKKAGNVGTYWIDPNGKTYKVPGTHTAWVGRNVEKLNKKFGYDLPLGLNEQGGHQYTDLLLDRGWVRILGTPGNAQFVIDVKDLNNIPPSVDNFIAENFKTWWEPPIPIWIGTGNNMLTIYDPFPNIQDAVNKALSQKRMGSKAFSKKEITARTSSNAWLMDPNGKLYPVVNDDHEETALKLFNKSIYDLLPKGWVTIRTIDNNIAFSVNKLNRIPSTVDDYLARNNVKRIAIIPADANLEGLPEPPSVDYEDAIEYGIQKAINRDIMLMRNRPTVNKYAEQKPSTIEYACIMANIPKEISQEIVEWGVRNVKDEDIYMKDGLLGRELDSHITIKYGIISDNPKEVEKLFEGMKPFKATLGEVKHFSPEDRDFDVLTVSVESKDLSDMNEKITKELKCATGLPSDEYHPHITIAYIKKDTCKDLYGNKEFVGKEITIDSVEFSPVEGDKTSIELGNKKEAAYRGNMSLWLAPDGQEYQIKSSHDTWLMKNRTMIFDKYKIDIDARDEHDKVGWMIQQGWVRVDGYLPVEVDLNVADINNIPQAVEQFAWKYKPEMVIVEDLNHKDISFDREEYSKGMMKKAEFLPSMAENAPTNPWQTDSDVEICLQPDPVSDEETFYAPTTVQKPRDPDIYRQFLSMFSKPISKKDEMTVDSAYDPEMEEAESKEMGEEPLIEYQKGFYDPKKHDFPHNTTWDAGPDKAPNQHEPYSPLPVTLDVVTNPENEAQNSPGGFPNRFCRSPQSEWFSDEGEIVPALENMFKNREAAINSLTRDITASLEGWWISPDGAIFEVPSMMEHDEWLARHLPEQLKEAHGDWKDLMTNAFELGWIRIRMLGSMYIQVNDIHNIPSIVDDFIVSHKAPLIAVADKYEMEYADQISYEDAIQSGIQKAVNRRLQEQKLAPVAKIIDSLTRDITADYTHAYWIDPNGKVFQVRGSDADAIMKDLDRSNESTHGGWVLKNLDMLQKDYGIDPHSISGTANSLVELGWTRIGDAFGTDWGITVNDTNNIPSFIDDVIAQFAPEGSIITVATPGSYGANYTFEWPVKSIQQTVNRIKQMRGRVQKQPVMAKKAELINFQSRNGLTFPVLLNPSKQEFLGAVKRYGIVRLLKSESGIYVWDANEMTHLDMVKALRALGYEDAENYFPKKGYTSKSVGDKVTVEDMNGHWVDISIDELLSNQLVMAKQASIEDVGGLPVLVNPSEQELINFSSKLRAGRMFRGLLDPHTGDLFAWDAYEAIHQYVIPKLGLDVKYSEESPFCLYFPPSSIYDALERQQEVKQGKLLRVGSVDVAHTKDWLLRHKTPMDAEGRAILYHGTPKANAEVLRANGLRQWSLLAQTPEEAIHYAGRDRDLKPKNITVFEVHVPVDKLNGGVFASVAEALGPEYLKEIKIGKQAGSQSASVPDYLCDEFKTEQINNDTDEVPYRNKDQRDYPNGFHDSPENTGTGIGWPKDNQRAVVRLDTLEDSFYRTDPFGVGEYNVTWYMSLPESDGIEKGNPE
jgi:2'-5' RNA ligase